MRGPTQRNEDGVVYRIDGLFHTSSARAQIEVCKTPVFFRETKSNFQLIQALERPYRNRSVFFRECVKIMALIAPVAVDLGYDDRKEVTKHALEALKCLLKRGPIPDWARIEDAANAQVPHNE